MKRLAFTSGANIHLLFANASNIFNGFCPKFYIIGLLTIIMLFLNVGCGKKKTSTEAMRLEIDTHSSQPLRHTLYGFNTNMITGDYGYLDPEFVELTKTLAPKTLRFPGGTVGNFYHWENPEASLRMK